MMKSRLETGRVKHTTVCDSQTLLDNIVSAAISDG